jgi:hypothetical protein
MYLEISNSNTINRNVSSSPSIKQIKNLTENNLVQHNMLLNKKKSIESDHDN